MDFSTCCAPVNGKRCEGIIIKDFTFFYRLYSDKIFDADFVIVWDPAKERLALEQKPYNMENFYEEGY